MSNRRYLGEIGESTLRNWASQVGIAAIKADPDRSGWDFLLEFPDANDSAESIVLPLDKQPRAPQCLIQVKATDGRPGKRSVKLSNWVRLVKSPLPAFFLVLEFDSKDSCQRAYLVHVDEAYCYAVLKRLRELDSCTRTQLHRKSLQFKWNKVHRLPSLTGEGLEKAIRGHVESFERYVERKIEVLRSVGYEDGEWRLDFVIPVPPDQSSVQETLVDFSLGLIPHLEVTQGEVTDCRFGLPASEPVDTFEGGRLLVAARESAGPGTVTLSIPESDENVRLSSEVYLPQGLGFELDRECLKARFAAPFVDFIFWLFRPGRLGLRYTLPDPSEESSLKQLRSVSELVVLLNDAGSGSGRVRFEARLKSECLFTGHIDVEEKLNRRVVDYAKAVLDAWTIAKHFDVHDAVDVKPIELLGQKPRLGFMASVLSPNQPSVRLLFWANLQDTGADKKVCLPYVIPATIGPYRMATAVAVIGQVETTGKSRQEDDELWEYEVHTHDVRLARQYLCRRDEGPACSFNDLAQAVVDEYEKSVDILILENINDYPADVSS